MIWIFHDLFLTQHPQNIFINAIFMYYQSPMRMTAEWNISIIFLYVSSSACFFYNTQNILQQKKMRKPNQTPGIGAERFHKVMPQTFPNSMPEKKWNQNFFWHSYSWNEKNNVLMLNMNKNKSLISGRREIWDENGAIDKLYWISSIRKLLCEWEGFLMLTKCWL